MKENTRKRPGKPSAEKNVVKNIEKKIKKKEVRLPDIKLFGRWDTNVEVKDLGLKKYMNIEPRFLPRSVGVHRKRFHKSKIHIVERLASHMMVPGHTGKRHRLTSGKLAGNLSNNLAIVEKAFDIIEKNTKQNPVEIMVRALENSALREEIISYQLGSIVARDAVITAPQRRIDKTLRIIAQAAYRKSFSSKKSIEQTLADELIAAYKNSPESAAIKERERIEREASGAR